MIRCGRMLKRVALAVTAVALTAGSLLAQDRSDREERRERLEREVQARAMRMAVGRRAVMGVLLDREGPDDGARISQVLPGGPADEAGLRDGDVLTSVDGRSLLESLPDRSQEERLDPDESLPAQRLVRLTRRLEPGEPVELGYRRGQESRTATVIPERARRGFFSFGRGGLDGFRGRMLPKGDFRGAYRFELPEGGGAVLRHRGDGSGVFHFRGADADRIGRCPGTSGGWSVLHDGCVAGLRLVPLNERLGQYFEAEEGVLVADVDDDSELGVAPGDVIQAIDGRSVATPRDVTRILGSYRPGEQVTFRAIRKGDGVTLRGSVK